MTSKSVWAGSGVAALATAALVGQMIIIGGPPKVGPLRVILAASCSSAHVQAAIDEAADRETVAVPAGSCTWSSSVDIDGKGITLRPVEGAAVTITDSLTTAGILRVTVGATPVRVTGFTFDANSTNKTGTQPTIDVLGTGTGFRIDNNTFNNILKRGIRVNSIADGDPLYGVIDNNAFNCPTEKAACQGVAIIAGDTFTSDLAASSASFGRPLDLGGPAAVYVEDNVFTYADTQDGIVEGYGGARYVLRFNEICRGAQGHHGTDSGNYRGALKFEIYLNDFNCSTTARTHHLRSGTGVVFGNTYHADYGLSVMANERSNDGCSNCSDWGICDGTSEYDANESGGEGYACRDQIGTVFGAALDDASYTLVPLYSWSNTKDGAAQDLAFALAASGRLVEKHILENRNFYNEDASFDGTSGVGVGVIGSRPATCTTGVGYWATDEGSWNASGDDGRLYRCTATNTWTLHFTPYDYPHPLRSEP